MDFYINSNQTKKEKKRKSIWLSTYFLKGKPAYPIKRSVRSYFKSCSKTQDLPLPGHKVQDANVIPKVVLSQSLEASDAAELQGHGHSWGGGHGERVVQQRGQGQELWGGATCQILRGGWHSLGPCSRSGWGEQRGTHSWNGGYVLHDVMLVEWQKLVKWRIWYFFIM